MLHQFNKCQMITRSKKAAYLDNIDIFIANVEHALNASLQTREFIEDCIKHYTQGGHEDILRQNILSVCTNSLDSLKKLIAVGEGLVEAEKEFDASLAAGALKMVKNIARSVESVIVSTETDNIKHMIERTDCFINGLNLEASGRPEKKRKYE